ncbi:MAG TPA: SRPBCC family protein [Pyrinomonadaceae bacterium]|nr:SRPBCC family protein [Pyrinomonadaceae bacterium]
MQINNTPAAKAEMQIRKPVTDVFEAFVDPSITSRFWFTNGSDRLAVGKPIVWEWEMYKFSVQVKVQELEPNKRILVEWSAYAEPTEIEWIFTSLPDNTTFVSVTNRGFTGDGDQVMKQALESTEGFAFVLAGAKAWLEHGMALNLVRDRFPQM